MTAHFPIEKPAQRAVLGVAITLSALSFLAVCLRLLAQCLARKRWNISDYLIVVACVFAMTLQSIGMTGVVQCGIGWGHVSEVVATFGQEPITKLLKLILALQILWVLSLSFTKFSILFLYLRVFPVPSVNVIAWGTMGVVALWTVATILAAFFICRPLAFNWDQTIEGASCGNQVMSIQATGAINLITDVAVLMTPMHSLYKLHLAAYKKVILIVVFGLGVVTCIFSGLRISVLSSMDFADITYTIPLANAFSGLEPCLAIVLACVPLLRPLLRPLLGPSKYYTPNTTSADPYAKSSSTADAHRSKRSHGAFHKLEDNSSEYGLSTV